MMAFTNKNLKYFLDAGKCFYELVDTIPKFTEQHIPSWYKRGVESVLPQKSMQVIKPLMKLGITLIRFIAHLSG